MEKILTMRQRWLILLFVAVLGAVDSSAANSPQVWLSVHSTQPNVPVNTPELKGEIPYPLLSLFLGAIPPFYRQKAKEMGFNLLEIQTELDRLEVGGSYNKLSEGTKVTVTKEIRIPDQKAHMIVMTLNQPAVGVRFRLSMSSSIIRFLTATFRDLQGLEKVMDSFLKEIQNLPPGQYLSVTDGHKIFKIVLE